MEIKKVDMIVDLQYGSTGKGLIAGYLAEKNGYDVVINANMPNAGHTYIDDKGQKMMHKVLPNGIVSHNCRWALIGPGSVFDPDRLGVEIDQAMYFGYMQDTTVLIHPNAVVLSPDHIAMEELKLKGIGSTCQGSSEAMIAKIRRSHKNLLAKDIPEWLMYKNKVSVASVTDYNYTISKARRILAEGAQGFSLGINQQFYPYCTSRECTPAQFMLDMGIPLPYLKTVIGTARTYPIRVGGTSGGCYDDQVETSWEKLGLTKEYTTVTGRERRVFTFSHQQMYEAIWAMAPDEIFLNFCNYMTVAQLAAIMPSFQGLVRYLGHGPRRSDVSEVQRNI